MEIMNLFPTPVGIKYYKIEDVTKLIEPFIQELKDSKKSMYNILDREGKTVEKIRNKMREDVNEYAQEIGTNCTFDIDSSWVFVNEKVGAHHHSIVPIVSCFYIDADDGTIGDDIGRIKLLDPRNGVNLYSREPIRKSDGKHSGGKATSNYFDGTSEHPITPRTGLMLIFPGYLSHYVDQNISSKNRIIVGANWERKLDLDKIDQSFEKTPRGTPMGVGNRDHQNDSFLKYIKKNYK